MDPHEVALQNIARKHIPLPLEPVSTAPPEIAARWLKRVAAGVFISLVILAWTVGFHLFVWIFPGLGILNHISVPVVSIAGVVSVWLWTSPEPGNSYWLVWLRWIARVGVFASPAIDLMRAVVLHIPALRAEDFAIPYASLELLGPFCVAAIFGYCSRLSARLGDNVLRVCFSILKWIFGLMAVLFLASSLFRWEDTYQRYVEQLSRSHDGGATMRTWQYSIMIPVCFCSLGIPFFWLEYRLWNRLRKAARKIRYS